MFWTRLRFVLARAAGRGLKLALKRAKNIFMLKKIKISCSNYHFGVQ